MYFSSGLSRRRKLPRTRLTCSTWLHTCGGSSPFRPSASRSAALNAVPLFSSGFCNSVTPRGNQGASGGGVRPTDSLCMTDLPAAHCGDCIHGSGRHMRRLCSGTSFRVVRANPDRGLQAGSSQLMRPRFVRMPERRALICVKGDPARAAEDAPCSDRELPTFHEHRFGNRRRCGNPRSPRSSQEPVAGAAGLDAERERAGAGACSCGATCSSSRRSCLARTR